MPTRIPTSPSSGPGLASLWDAEKNAGINFVTFDATHASPVWWRCPNGHSFQRPPVRMLADDADAETVAFLLDSAKAKLWRHAYERPTTSEPPRNLRPQVASRSRWARIEALVRNRAFAAECIGTTWSQQAYVKASNTNGGDDFGYSVALSSDGSTLAVGPFQEAGAATGINGNQASNSAFLRLVLKKRRSRDSPAVTMVCAHRRTRVVHRRARVVHRTKTRARTLLLHATPASSVILPAPGTTRPMVRRVDPRVLLLAVRRRGVA